MDNARSRAEIFIFISTLTPPSHRVSEKAGILDGVIPAFPEGRGSVLTRNPSCGKRDTEKNWTANKGKKIKGSLPFGRLFHASSSEYTYPADEVCQEGA
jgi:hypothetical protein